VSRFVLDASVSAGWIIPDKSTDYAIQVRQRLAEGERALVPGLWAIEMANVLAKAVRHGTLAANDAEDALGQLQILFIPGPKMEVELTAPAVWQVYDAARKYQLSAFDACYLELAQREGLPLATLDRGLRAAAAKAGVARLK
jgi:predicted nucleic acid-binding protein